MPVNPKPAEWSGTLGARIIELDPIAVAVVHYRSPPRLVCEVTFDGLEQPCLEPLGRSVTRLEGSLHRIDGVAAIVSRPILHEGDQIGGINAKRGGAFRKALANLGVGGEDFVDVPTDGLHHIDVLPLGVTAEVVRLTQTALLQNALDTPAVITYEQPVADLHPVAIDRQRLSIERVDDRQRDQLFRKMIRPVI